MVIHHIKRVKPPWLRLLGGAIGLGENEVLEACHNTSLVSC